MRAIPSIVLTLACGLPAVAPALTAWGQCEIIEDGLTEDPTAAGNKFGTGVALSGTFLVVGAPGASDSTGVVRILEFDGLQWVQMAELIASDGAAGDNLGRDVALTDGGMVIVAGAQGDNGSAGAAYVFEQPAGGWSGLLTETAKLTASDGEADDALGGSVDIDGDWIVVGAESDDHASGIDAGSIYVFQMPVSGWVTAFETDKLVADDGAQGDQFGSDVAIDQAVVLAGALEDDLTGSNEGSAYVFRFAGTWSQEQKLTASDGTNVDWFGSSVDVESGTAVIGAYHDSDAGTFSGSAYVFEYDGMTWSEDQKLTPVGAAFGEAFGFSVAISGDKLVIGAVADGGTGSARTFRFDGTTWLEAAKLLASDGDPGDQFGHAVTLSGDRAAVGAPLDHDGLQGDDEGSAYVFSVTDLCDQFWTNPNGGNFDTPGNWDTGTVPGPSSTAIFDMIGTGDPAYQVIFPTDATTDRLIVHSNREVTLRMDGHDYLVTGTGLPSEPSTVVGECTGGQSVLRIDNPNGGLHGLLGSRLSIGDGPGCDGMVIVTGTMSLLESHDTIVGGEGIGTLLIEDGARFETIGSVSVGTTAESNGSAFLSTAGSWTTSGSDFFLGESGDASMAISGAGQLQSNTGTGVFIAMGPVSTATLSITGPESQWIEQSATLFIGQSGQGTVTLADDATLQFPLTVCSNGCEVRGIGALVGNVTNVGAVRPGDDAGTPASGVLTVDGGDYSQRDFPEGAGEENSGSLFIDLFGPTPDLEHDVLALQGNANLGGGLFLEFTGGFDPPVSSQFSIISTVGLLFDTFDVAYTTGLPPDKLAVVEYEPGPGGGVNIAILALGEDVIFGAPDASAVEGAPADAVLADLDGDIDNLPDLAVALRDFDQVAILVNQGTDPPSFVQTQLVAVGASPSGIVAATLDGNGSIDLAVSNAGDDSVSILFNDGSGDFAVLPPNTASVGASPSDLAFADFDGLGGIDLAVTNLDDDTVSILLNDGTGSFPVQSSVTVGDGPRAIAAAGFDALAAMDLLVANELDDTVIVLIGDGGGGFTQGATNPVGGQPHQLDPVDIDNDKDFDALVGNLASGDVSIILGNGDGTFVPSVNLPVGGSPSSLTSLDVDQDGDIDVAVVIDDPVDGRVIRVLRNDLIHDGTEPGQLAFVLDENVLGQGQDPILVLSDDVDGDGDEDLVTVNDSVVGPAADGQASMAVLLNQADACPADLNGNGQVDFADILAVIAAWGPCNDPCPEDLDGSGSADFADILAVIAAWGPCA